MFIGNKKCRIYAACGVSQTPNKYQVKEECNMLIAKEGRKNLEAKANYIDPRGGCGCATSSIKTATRDAVCVCGCKKATASKATVRTAAKNN